MEKLTHIELTDIQCEDVKPRTFDVNASSIIFQVRFRSWTYLFMWFPWSEQDHCNLCLLCLSTLVVGQERNLHVVNGHLKGSTVHIHWSWKTWDVITFKQFNKHRELLSVKLLMFLSVDGTVLVYHTVHIKIFSNLPCQTLRVGKHHGWTTTAVFMQRVKAASTHTLQ